MDIVNRLKHYMDTTGTTISQFSDRCGIPRPTMSQMLNGRNKRVSDEVIAKIHNAYPELSILWLLFGEGEMEKNENMQISEPQNDPDQSLSLDLQPESQSFAAEYEDPAPYGNSFPDNFSGRSPAYGGMDFGGSLFDVASSAASTSRRPDSATTSPSDNAANPPATQATAQSDISFAASQTDAPLPRPETADTPANPFHAPATASELSSRQSPSSPLEASSQMPQPAAQVSPQPFQQSVQTSQTVTENIPGQPEATGGKPISILPDSRKKITNIVVFYSDNSFQSFLPEV